MNFYKSAAEVLSGFPNEVALVVAAKVKTLLQERHLYQSVELTAEELGGKTLPRVTKELQDTAQKMLASAIYWRWQVSEVGGSVAAMLSEQMGKPKSTSLTWQAPDVKLFCKTCARVEPFNSVGATNLLRNYDQSTGVTHAAKVHEAYVLRYLCQSCKSVPEIFLLRRQAWKVTLCGRAPMEHVASPDSIPKQVSKFYSDAVVAHQSGQTLAGLFFIRTLCEQWAKLFASPEDRADEALSKYALSLPQDFKQRFPSLGQMYSELSAAIHAANPDEALFTLSIQRLHQHFEARRLFSLPSPSEIAASSEA